jgi:hypothetical protein
MHKTYGKSIGLGILLLAVALLFSITAQANPESANIQKYVQASAAPLKLAPVNIQPAAPVHHTFDLCATTGTVGMPDGTLISIWGYVDISGGQPCVAGSATIPGPELRVTEGDSVTINLTNKLSSPTSLLISGQMMTASGGTPGLFTNEAPANGVVSYEIASAQAGTYMYESGSNPDIQVAMGLYGAFIVEESTPTYLVHREAVLVMSAIDPNLHANPAGFDMYDYAPTYWLLNGQPFNWTSPQSNEIPVQPGENLLLRYVNAGYLNSSMALLGTHQYVIAQDGFNVNYPHSAVAETIPAGSTMDAIVAIPADANIGGFYLLYNRNMKLVNDTDASHTAGMMTSIKVANFGVAINPATTTECDLTGPAGSQLVCNMTVTNTGTTIDTFDITVATGTFNTFPATSVGPLAPGASANLTMVVSVPATANTGDTFTATVTATSQGNNTATDIATINVTVDNSISPATPQDANSFAPAAGGQNYVIHVQFHTGSRLFLPFVGK